MENIIVGAIVALAGLWAGLRLFRRRKASTCASGCSGCSVASKPQPLVKLRGRR
jgi:hypothetical protein